MTANQTIVAVIVGFICLLWGIATLRKWRRRKKNNESYNFVQIHRTASRMSDTVDRVVKCRYCGMIQYEGEPLEPCSGCGAR